jgi:hypothetical protein
VIPGSKRDFRFADPLAHGAYYVTVVAVDRAGHTRQSTIATFRVRLPR